MAHVTIFGAGNMATAISSVITKGGNTVDHLGRDDADRTIEGDIVILAVPYPALAEIAQARGEQLAGKIVVDITNPLNFETFDSLTVAADGSATAELAVLLPQSRVLKAFNTNFAATIASGVLGATGAPEAIGTTVLIAGDDSDAKASLSEVVTAGGLKVIDAGRLDRARELEAIGFLQLTLAVNELVGWTGGFGVAA